MSLALDPQTEQRIQHEITAGGFSSANELLNEALDLLEDDYRRGLNETIKQGLHELERGQTIPGSRIEEMILERRVKQAS